MERKQPDLVLIVARSFATKLATPALIIDARGDLVYFNDAAAELLGRSYPDLGSLEAASSGSKGISFCQASCVR